MHETALREDFPFLHRPGTVGSGKGALSAQRVALAGLCGPAQSPPDDYAASVLDPDGYDVEVVNKTGQIVRHGACLRRKPGNVRKRTFMWINRRSLAKLAV